MFRLPLVVFVWLMSTVAPSGALAGMMPEAVISGRVTDETGGVLPGAVVEARTGRGALVAVATTDAAGDYRVVVPAGEYVIEAALVNFSRSRLPGIVVRAGGAHRADISLALTLTADVTVTGKRTFRNLGEVESAAGLMGAADSATEGVVTARQIDARPIQRAGEILESVPGLVISQHSGEGKANQYYLRGFNLDHGTDFATTVAGVPVNLPTHAHGHGYSDTNFIIPELVSGVQFRKGPYSADEGDFSTAGAAHIRYVNTVERPVFRASGGADGWARLFGAASPRVGEGHLLLAVEANHHDGPWMKPDDYRKLNAVVRFSRGDLRNGFSFTAMSYTSVWDGTDQVPQRAIVSGRLARFAGVDRTTGGDTARHTVSADWQRTSGAGVTRATAYAMRYRLNLFSNFTYFLDDPDRGDQFEQEDRRLVGGGRLAHTRAFSMAGRAAELVVGGDLRVDDIGTIGLFRTQARVRHTTVRDDAVRQASASGFAQHELQVSPWLRSRLGVRIDAYRFRVAASDARNSGTEVAALASPKASLVFGPWRSTEIYANGGDGFHSNDARGTTITVDPATGDAAERVTPLVRARGAELGVRTMALRRTQLSAALWQLDLDSELRFVGDAGTTEAGRPSRRWGVEVSGYHAPWPGVTVDADVAWTRARFRDDAPAGVRIPGSVALVVGTGVTFENRGPVFGSVRLRAFGARELVEDGSVRSAPTRLVNAQAGVKLGRQLRLVFDGFNLFDSKVNDIDYFYTSRLPGEPAAGVSDIHLHPVLPRAVRAALQWAF